MPVGAQPDDFLPGLQQSRGSSFSGTPRSTSIEALLKRGWSSPANLKTAKDSCWRQESLRARIATIADQLQDCWIAASVIQDDDLMGYSEAARARISAGSSAHPMLLAV
jgi:hypothetical protein